MSGEETSLILARLDRLEHKIDTLATRYERHEALEESRQASIAEFRRFLYGVAGGVVLAALAGLGGLIVSILRQMG